MKITAITPQVKRRDRYSIFVDDAYAFSLSENGLLESGLHAGQQLDAAELRALKKAAGLDKAYQNALRYVALRPRSQWEMGEYLRRKEVDAAAATHIVQRLQQLGLLNDAAFARSWVAYRRGLKSISRRRLQLELAQKRIAEDIIAQVLREDSTADHAALANAITKKRRRYPDQQKLIRYLASQGFLYEDIKSALADDTC